MSCVAAGLVYGIACIDAIVLQEHPVDASLRGASRRVFGLGIVSSVDRRRFAPGDAYRGYISFGIYILIGLAIYWGMERLHNNGPRSIRITLTPDDVESIGSVSSGKLVGDQPAATDLNAESVAFVASV